MLIKSKDLKGYKLGAKDGDIGKTKQFYFDDNHWTIRYLVASTGNWLSKRVVLISPYSLESIDVDDRVIHLNLTKKQIENSPSLESDQPVSHQFEESYSGYYGFPMYWGGNYPWGLTPSLERGAINLDTSRERHWDQHLRSTHAVAGYQLQARDGKLGHIEDFIIDDTTWAIRYLIVDTANWLPGKKVLISPLWIDSVSWLGKKVFVSLTQEEIRTAPAYSEQAIIGRTYESDIHKHYGRVAYWEDEAQIHKNFRSMNNRLRFVI
jgi:hypothetical protein